MAMRGMSVGLAPKPIGESLLGISWHNTAQVPHLNAMTVMDYFANPSNPFYDRTCNNEIIKMQRLSPEHLASMTGIEYIVIHTQEPILYVIRKQSRQSPNHAVPLSDYYIIAGHVYQAPDLGTVINSRVLNVIHHLESALDESMSYSRYHPSRGYWWEFTKDQEAAADKKKKAASDEKKLEEGSSMFQRQRVDMLLSEWSKSYPPKFAPRPVAPNPAGPPTETPPAGGSGQTQDQPDGRRQPAGSKAEEQAAAPSTSAQPRPEGAQQFVGNRGPDDSKVQQPPEKRRRIE